MIQHPSLIDKLSKRIQTRINSWIPEKVHEAITVTIKQMIRGVLFGATYTAAKTIVNKPFELRETAIKERIKNYRNTAAIEGGITGAGGLLLGLADFPILLGIKLKLLFDIASMYGYDVKNYKERPTRMPAFFDRDGGKGGIRTHGTLLRFTAFPMLPVQPLLHLSTI